MKKGHIAGIVVLVLIVLGYGYFLPGPKEAQGEPIRIGGDFDLTGNTAQYGEWTMNGAKIAIEEINAAGGVNGRSLELIPEDNQAEVAQAVSAYQKLRDADNVKYVITFLSSIALAVEPLANSDKIVQVDVGATTPKYSTPDDYSFRTGIVANQLAGNAADFLTSHNGGKVALLYINNDFGLGMKNVFRESFKGEIVAEESFPQGGTDFRTQLSKIKVANPDTILFVSHLKEGGLLVKQARDMGITAKLFADVYSVEGPDFIQGAGSAAEGLEYLAPAFDVESKDATVASFVKKYREAYGAEPAPFAAQAYDAVHALARAMKGCEYEDTDCVRKNMSTLDFAGASSRIKFDNNGDILKPVELKTVKDGKFVRVETIK